MDPSKEAKDDSNVLALAEEAKIGEKIDQLWCMTNNRNMAMLKIEIHEKELHSSIINVAKDIIIVTVVDHKFTPNTCWQRPKKRDMEFMLDNKELWNVIAHDMISNFPDNDA